MKIALLGYGKMGKEIEKIALDRNHQIVLTIDENNPEDLIPENIQKADVAIEFSAPVVAYENISKALKAGVPVVSGTTGWLDRYQEIVQLAENNNAAFFYASNYSIGVNIFFYLNKQLAEIMNKYPEFDVEMEETHHIHKLDAPSGTAITLAEDILARVQSKTNWELDQASTPDKLKIKAKREGEVPGIHEINYISEIDHIQIRHSAKNRKGFATGAVLAAEFIKGKKGEFGMQDLLGF